MMEAPKVGQKITGAAFRDAIHVAIAPVTAADTLEPGQHVGLDGEGKATGKSTTYIGITDPFLQERVYPGEMFWLFIYPNTVTSLRHAWVHPAFKVKVPGVK